ncbi:MAG TPA: hypothetical protein VMZ50_10030, partial [Phycisphaerae bacterium]|nr:hypothetical protein [Phycisphaerae bacterium]
ADENLIVKIAKSDLAGAVGGSWTTCVFKYHYQGDNDIPGTVLHAGDWCGKLLRYWGRAVGGNAVGDLLTSPDDANAGSWNEFSSWIVTSLDASKGGNNVSFTVSVDTGDSGKLKYVLTNAGGSCEAWFYVRIDNFGVIPTTGYADIGDGD